MSGDQQQVFTSWKEIASYLGKSVRTVQRWEHELDLPVQRPHVKTKGTVRVCRTDLDEWVERTWFQRSSKPEVVISPARGKVVVNESIETSRQLRAARKKFLEQLQVSLDDLTESCGKLQGADAQKQAQRKAKAANG